MFGNGLRRLRAKYGLTQVQVAVALEIATGAYPPIEQGVYSPRSDLVMRVCRFFEVTWRDLFGITDDAAFVAQLVHGLEHQHQPLACGDLLRHVVLPHFGVVVNTPSSYKVARLRQKASQAMAQDAQPSHVRHVVEVNGKPIGTVFCLLDYNPRIKAINGRLFPFGFLKLLWNKKAIKRMRAISTNVVTEYQAWGIGLVLMSGLYERFIEWGLEEVEFSWVLESNYLSRRTLERGDLWRCLPRAGSHRRPYFLWSTRSRAVSGHLSERHTRLAGLAQRHALGGYGGRGCASRLAHTRVCAFQPQPARSFGPPPSSAVCTTSLVLE
jgi:DNA-binding XRE family transcriptional regulator